MKRLFLVFFIGFGFLLHSITLNQILEKNFEVSGGKDKIASIKNAYMEGKIVQNGMEMPMKIWYEKKDNKFKVVMTVMQQKMVFGFDGKIAWWIMPMMGINEPQEIPEAQRDQFMEQMDQGEVNPFFNYKEKGNDLKYLGETDLEGTPVYKLEMTKKNKDKIYFYLDKENFVIVKTEMWKKKNDSEVHIESFPGEYKKIEGILFAHNIEVVVNGKASSSVIFEKVKFNNNFSEDLFDMKKQE